MTLKRQFKGIPLLKLLRFIISFSIVVQLFVITYTHFSGYAEVENYRHFLSKLAISSLLTFLAGGLIVFPNIALIKTLDAKLPWEHSLFLRIITEGLSVLFLALMISVPITALSHSINAYEQGLTINLLYNALIFGGCSLLLTAILEAWLLYYEANESKKLKQKLEQELTQIHYEVLKNQINPHFIFNSLNVLSVLVEKDEQEAQKFIHAFSSIYRYVLETIEQPLVRVEQELSFVRSFMLLQNMRHNQAINYTINLPTACLAKYIPPFALQIPFENACKHNILSPEQPLTIDLTYADDQLVVSNTYQPKTTYDVSHKVGQKNLAARYLLICNKQPTFRLSNDRYIAKLPLLEKESL